MSAGPPPPPDDLHGVLDDAWRRLHRGVRDRRHGFRTPVLATVTAGGTPEARTVVLRHADRAAGVVAAHSDVRSPKVAQLRAAPGTAWVFWDRGASVQVRITGPASVEAADESALAAEIWRRTGHATRKPYLAPRPPSIPADGPSANEPADLHGTIPEPARSEDGRANYVLLRVAVERLEWLRLGREGHRRAAFRRQADGDWDATWLEP